MGKDDFEYLKTRIYMLENENRLLKQRLDEAGISYADIVGGAENRTSIDAFDPNQGARIKKFEVTDRTASIFFMMFCRGRKDVYDLRYSNPISGKTGYYTQCQNIWKPGCHRKTQDGVSCKNCDLLSYRPLGLNEIKAHLLGDDPNGNDVVAIYPMLENNMCQLLVFDFDNHAKGAEQNDYANEDNAWKEEVNSLRQICKNLGIDAVVERSRSGQGAHLWIFFKEIISARLARKFGYTLLEKGAESVNLKSFKYYDRMVPTQDVLPEGGLGNVIALPLQGRALKSGNSAFVDENWNAYENQLEILGGAKRLTKQEIEDLATPISGENVVEQYVGRLNRDYDGKENVIVYDYVDCHIPKFDKMYAARLKAYKKIGYELCINVGGEKQQANAIYDINNYAETYWKDIEEARTNVVISSPRLNTQKVKRIIDNLEERQELGIKVTIVTWHPDAYKYGRDDVRMELLEELRKAGFEIKLVSDNCEHYAVIDNEIVWYGNVNLLSKEDAEDNLMRVFSKEIAAELLEMTFAASEEMYEW